MNGRVVVKMTLLRLMQVRRDISSVTNIFPFCTLKSLGRQELAITRKGYLKY